MKRIFSTVLALVMILSCTVTVFSAEKNLETSTASLDVSASGTSGYVYFQKPDNWSGTQIYCHICQADGDKTAFFGWQLKAEKCTDEGNGKWSYDLSILDNSTQLDAGLGNGSYLIMFSDNVGNDSCPLMFNKKLIGDTFKILDKTETTYESPSDSTIFQWKGSWTKNAKKYGIPLMITSVGTIQGTFIDKGNTVDKIIDDWDQKYKSYPNHAAILKEIKKELSKMVSKGKILYAGGGKYTDDGINRQVSDFDISKWTVYGIKNKTYTGKKIKQKIIVTNGKINATVKITYSDNKNVGKAIMAITGTGEYTGTIIKTFKILKAKQKIKVKGLTKTVGYYSLLSKAQNVKKAVSVKNAVGKVSFAKISKGSSDCLKVSKNGTVTVSRYTNKGTYKIIVKVTAKGNKNYKSCSKTATATIKVQ